MKKLVSLILTVVCIFTLFSCGNKSAERLKTYEGDLKTYYEMSDGSWECDGRTYKYRLEISGRMNDAASDSTFVYLSNLESNSFEETWRAAGLSSSNLDYFDIDVAVLVDWNIK